MWDKIQNAFASIGSRKKEQWWISDEDTNHSDSFEEDGNESTERSKGKLMSFYEYGLDPSNRKSFILISSIFGTTILLLSVVIGLAMATPKNSTGTNSVSSKAHTRKYEKLEARVSGTISDPSTLEELYSPQTMALDWLVQDDANYSIDSDMIIQRYALMTLFYSLGGRDWFSSTNWLSSGKNECLWKFVQCNINKEIISLDLSHNNLKGTIPKEIGTLSMLEELKLKNNFITGSIPRDIGSISMLEFVDLSINKLDGTIPSSITNLRNLNILKLDVNNLTGSLPSDISSLSNLKTLDVSSNVLSNNIPTTIGQLSKLKELDLSNNKINGSLPETFGALVSLEKLDLSVNQITGSIPTVLTLLKRLKQIILSRNKVSGPIPFFIGEMRNLINIEIGYNELTGNIPISIGKLAKLEYLTLKGNNLSGSIPNEVGYPLLLSKLYLCSIYCKKITNNFSYWYVFFRYIGYK